MSGAIPGRELDSDMQSEAKASDLLIYACDTLEKHLKICRRLPMATAHSADC